MNPTRQYGPTTWLASRRVLSTAAGVGTMSTVGGWFAFNGVSVVQLNANEPRWLLGHTMIVSTLAALVLTLNTLPAAPEWERPLQRRTQVAHGMTWLSLATLGATGPLISHARVCAFDGMNHSYTDLAFYGAALGITTVCIMHLGRVTGSVVGIAILLGVIVVEQEIGWLGAIADTRHSAQWLLPTVSLVCAVVLVFRSGGALPQRQR